MKIVLAAINAKYIHANLAVCSLRAFSDEYKEQIQIKEYTINQYTEDILADLYKEKADMVAFSCYIWNIGMVEELTELLHQIRPDMPIWFGGPEVSYDAAECLERNPGVTGVIRGEGEETFHELMQYYIDGSGKLEDIRGIVYRENGQLVDNGWREVMDLNKVPFVYEDMNDFKNKIIYYETSRGCPFSCSYCLSSVDKKVRLRDMALVEKELQFFIDHEVPQVKFVDRTFNCNKKHAMAIWRYIKAHDNGITNFHFEIGADLLDDEELAILSDMRPGLVQLEIGVQSTNDATIQEVSRTMRLDRLAKAVHTVNVGHNIHQHLDLIAGLPYEDYDRFRQSFNDVYQMEPEQLQLGFLKVLKGSYMEELIPDCDLLYSAAPPYEVLCTKWLSYGDVLELKDIEEMTEVHYNSRQFTCTLKELEKEFDTPYEMFSFMAGYYNKNHLFGISHSRIARYEILWKIIQERLEKNGKCETQGKPENGGVSEKLEQYRDLLMTDLYLRENVKSRPTFARDLSDSKDFVREFFQREEKTPEHLSGYEGYDSRQMAKMAHLEPLRDGTYLLFDYKKRDPLSYNARTVRV